MSETNLEEGVMDSELNQFNKIIKCFLNKGTKILVTIVGIFFAIGAATFLTLSILIKNDVCLTDDCLVYTSSTYAAQIDSSSNLKSPTTTTKTALTLNFFTTNISSTYQSVFIDKELFGSDSQVKSLAVLKDQSIASASQGEIKLWSSVDGSLLRTIDSGHIINSMVVMEDGGLISAGLDARIIIWNVTIGLLIRVLKGHFKAIYCLTVLNEENFASGSADASIIIWNANTGQQLKKLKETNCWVWSLAALDKHKLVFASYDHTIKIFDTKSDKETKQLIGHQSEVTCLLELTDNRLASGSADSSIRIWDTQKAIVLHELKGHTEIVSSLVLLKDGLTLISASLDATIRMWDIETGQLIKKIERKLENKPQGRCLALALLGDGRLVSGWEDKSIIIWQLKSIQFEHVLNIAKLVEAKFSVMKKMPAGSN